MSSYQVFKYLSSNLITMRFLYFFLMLTPALAQENINNEIFLFDLVQNYDSISLTNGENISHNQGYDNQPSFYSSDTILFSSTRNGQTDIAAFSIKNSIKHWLSSTGHGSEYSPRPIPGESNVAAVRLDTTGLQLLYKYETGTGNSKVFLPDQKVGYYFFYDETTLITAALSGTGMDLMKNDLKTGTSEILIKKIGRSIHKIPQSHLISYTILNEQNELDLYLLDLEKEEPESFFLTSLPAGVQDYSWLDQDRILLGKGSTIFMYDMLGDSEWTQVADLAEYGLDNITRITVNEAGDKVVLVAEIKSK